MSHSRDLTFRDVIEIVSAKIMIIRSRWPAGLLAAIIIGGGVGFALLRNPTEYTARTVLFAQGALDKVIGSQGNPSNDSLGLQLENTLRNHLSVMESRSFFTRLIGSLSPVERQAVVEPYLAPGEVADDEYLYTLLQSKITIDRERGREYFTVEVRHRSAATALLLATRFADQYLSLLQNQFRETNKEGIAVLETQAAALRKEIAEAVEKRLDFRKNNQIMSMADSQGILAERLKRVDAARTDARIERIRVETQLAQVKASMASAEFPWDNAYLSEYGNNPTLRHDLAGLMNQRAVLSIRYGPNHPKMLDVDAAISAVKSDIKHNFAVATQDLELQLAAVQRTEANLQAEFDDGFGNSIETEKLSSRSDIFATDIEVKQQNLMEIEKKIGDAGLYSQLPVNFMQVADPAFIVRPGVSVEMVKLGLAALVGFVAFCVTPVFIDLLDSRLRNTSDPEALLRLRLLGAIPILKGRRSRHAHIVRDGQDLAGIDAFGDVVGELDMMVPNFFPKVMVVTSTLAGEGKSVLVSNLAATYAAREKRAVIIDLDLRRPSQRRLQGNDGRGGIVHWFEAGFPMENLLEPTGPLGLSKLPGGAWLIPAGGRIRGPNHHLAGPQMTGLLQALRHEFDVVIIDTPPAGLFQDAIQLARLADERILVARISRATIPHIRKVAVDFENANAPLDGFIINGFNPRLAHQKIAYAYRVGRSTYYTRGHHPVSRQKTSVGRPSAVGQSVA
jgi:succinoglycan biosynthesis transport protein ExoP